MGYFPPGGMTNGSRVNSELNPKDSFSIFTSVSRKKNRDEIA